jgi:hypothetical protein
VCMFGKSKELSCVMAELINVGGPHKCAYPVTPTTIRIALVSGSDRRRDHAVYLEGLSDHGVSVACENGSHGFDDWGRYRS